MADSSENVRSLFDSAGKLAAENLRQILGEQQFRQMLDDRADVRLIIDLTERRVTVTLKWPRRFGDATKYPCSFLIPEGE